VFNLVSTSMSSWCFMCEEMEAIKFCISIVVYWDAVHILKDNTNGIIRFFPNK